MNKTAVILLGAGAPSAWKGPTTETLTNLLFEDRQYLTKQGINVAKFIHDTLKRSLTDKNEIIHFEHIIDSIESILNFIRDEIKYKSNTTSSSYSPAWFNLNDDYQQLENFKFEIEQGSSHGYFFNLANSSNDTPVIRTESNYKLMYFKEIIESYLNKISNEIALYDQLLESHKDISDSFNKFINLIQKKDYNIRIYTTNYDELFLKILQHNGTMIFNGFDINSGFPDIKKILNSDKINCYYNLHGSIHWQHGHNNRWEDTIIYSPNGHNQMYFNKSKQVLSNPHEKTDTYNIVTGFKKLQKISINPLNAFFTRLSMDCINADFVTSIGYSFGDPHINRLFSNAIKFNKAKFLMVTKGFKPVSDPVMIKNIMNGEIHSDFSSCEHWVTSERKGSVKIYKNEFKPFLENNEYTILEDWL